MMKYNPTLKSLITQWFKDQTLVYKNIIHHDSYGAQAFEVVFSGQTQTTAED